jgi:GxxExxY protein
MTALVYPELSYEIVGAAMEVHNSLGPGYLESVYQRELSHEFTLRCLRFREAVRLPVEYKGVLVGDYEADFIVDDKIVVELKAVANLHPRHQAQAANYLAASGLRLAIILNFGSDSLTHKRVVR